MILSRGYVHYVIFGLTPIIIHLQISPKDSCVIRNKVSSERGNDIFFPTIMEQLHRRMVRLCRFFSF